MYTSPQVRPHCRTYVTKPRCTMSTMTRFAGLMAIFLTLPFLIASHTLENVLAEPGNVGGEPFCESLTVQIPISSGGMTGTDRSGVAGICGHWQAYYYAPASGEVPVYFRLYEVRNNGSWNLISSAVCGPGQGECGRDWGTVDASSSILPIGVRPSGGIGGAVAEVDMSTW